jgi:hypothetical protein
MNETKCHRVKQNEPKQHMIAMNNQLTILPIALVALDEATALSCDHFYLPSSTSTTNEFIAIIENKTIIRNASRLINLYRSMNNNTQWKKPPYIPSHFKHILDHLITKSTTLGNSSTSLTYQLIPSSIVTIAIVTIILAIICIYLLQEVKKKTLKKISMPPI